MLQQVLKTFQTELYHVDQNDFSVKAFTTVDIMRDKHSGYIMFQGIHTNDEGKALPIRVVSSLVFETIEEAEQRLAEIKPIVEEAMKIEDEANKQLNEKRELVIGKPLV